MVHIMRRLLTVWRWEAVVAESVAEAIAALSNPSSPFDLVTIDIMLVDGTGMSVLKYIKDQNIKTKAIIMTALVTVEDIAREAETIDPNVITLAKPYGFGELESAVKAIYDSI